ncbi:MAG: YbaB/EbfC family nucleoid-associated protein [Candidatus Magasanikbacteria bacterium]|nr:YbaB/EbfC family nucleoid-associated protein [Candidatus Magasanikbacteria bacterium]
MFNKLKQFKDLRNTAKQMQNMMAAESVTVDKSGVKITMNGNMEITEIKIAGDISTNSLEGIIKSNVNDALKKTQKLMAEKMQEMGGFPGLGM